STDPRTLFRRAARQTPDDAKVPAVIRIGLLRGFQHQRNASQSWMREERPESAAADFPLSNVLMAIHTAAQSLLGIVGMDQLDPRQPDRGLDRLHECLHGGWG